MSDLERMFRKAVLLELVDKIDGGLGPDGGLVRHADLTITVHSTQQLRDWLMYEVRR